MENMIKKSIELSGRTLTLESGRLAKQASGSVLVTYGETVVLVAATSSKGKDEFRGFFPLTVDYREKFYASGKIPGGFFKREARPSEKEIIGARLTDRPLRPLFPEGFYNETQIFIIFIIILILVAIDVLMQIYGCTIFWEQGIWYCTG